MLLFSATTHRIQCPVASQDAKRNNMSTASAAGAPAADGELLPITVKADSYVNKVQMMTNQQAIELTRKYLMPTYAQLPVAFVRGEGAWLWDADGKQYLDFVGGIAVIGVGHCHRRVAEAICRQARTLMHTSNLYHIPPAAQLARRLCELSFADRAFFANSGAEANEAAIKLARKWALCNNKPGRDVVTAYQSFHGRTLATVTATGQEKYHKNFAPLPPGFKYAPFNDIQALAQVIDDNTCAVMLEPIQAEGGINVPDDDYLPQVRQLCDERGVLLILDEVQTGLGRCGKWFAYQHWGITPDIMTLAKSLGGGFPIGACLATEQVANCFQPGDHASTFGGNHLACAAALATLEVLQDEGLVDNAARMGALIKALFAERMEDGLAIKQIRGHGLLLAVQFADDVPAKQVEAACLQEGLVVNAMGDDRLRLAPPLVIGEEECCRAVDIICQAVIAVTG